MSDTPRRLSRRYRINPKLEPTIEGDGSNGATKGDGAQPQPDLVEGAPAPDPIEATGAAVADVVSTDDVSTDDVSTDNVSTEPDPTETAVAADADPHEVVASSEDGPVVADGLDGPTDPPADDSGAASGDAQPEPKRSRSAGKVGAIVAGVLAAVVVAVGAILIGANNGKLSASIVGVTTPHGKCAKYEPLGAMHGFNQPDNATSLGATDTYQGWTTKNATFGLSGKQARVVSRISGAPAQAIVKMDASDGVACTMVASVGRGAGLIFRWQDEANYWTVTAQPAQKTWNIAKVQGGASTLMGTTGPTPVTNGTVVSVRMIGSAITVYINGTSSRSLDSSANITGRGAGIVATGDEKAANDERWMNFVADSYTPLEEKAAQANAATETTAPNPGGK